MTEGRASFTVGLTTIVAVAGLALLLVFFGEMDWLLRPSSSTRTLKSPSATASAAVITSARGVVMRRKARPAMVKARIGKARARPQPPIQTKRAISSLPPAARVSSKAIMAIPPRTSSTVAIMSRRKTGAQRAASGSAVPVTSIAAAKIAQPNIMSPSPATTTAMGIARRGK